tara:strand:+ start:26633 stop:29293 length:2661 start_codon:yes stop_codon:yes gene_type:complete
VDSQIIKEVQSRLKQEFAFKKDTGKWYQQGRCPECGKQELFIHAETPKVLKCGRADRCGYEASVRSLFPEIFDSWSNRFEQSEQDPNAAADAYLGHGRGLDIQGLRGCYSQEQYHDKKSGQTTATIRFALPNDAWWERLIDQPGRFDKKARFKFGSSWGGHWWLPPAVTFETLARARRIWICEGIFDAMALNQAFRTSAKDTCSEDIAISNMTVNVWPEHALKALRDALTDGRTPELVFAFDVGAAGVRYTRQYVIRARKEGWSTTAAQVRSDGEGSKQDWNDLLQSEKLTDSDIDDYLYNGKITIAESAAEKAFLIYNRFGGLSFSITHATRTYWVDVNKTEIAKAEEQGSDNETAIKQALQIREIANCTFRILYRERDEALDETNYFLQMNFPGKQPTVKGRFSNGAMTSATDFKKRLFAFSGMFTGSTFTLDRIIKNQTRDMKSVEPIAYFGYSPGHKAWLFPKHAVRGGRVFKLNSEDYFDFGSQAAKLRSPEQLVSIEWNPDQLDMKWLPHLMTAWGAKGLVVLAFWVQSYFAVQIRKEQKSLPFLETVGIPGTGKSTIIEFLWKLCGRDGYEGFDPAKATPAAVGRNFNKVSNLPVVLLEGDRDQDTPHNRRFNFDELKDLYNGRSFRPRAFKNGGNETMEEPFRGALVISQNADTDASPAILERILHIAFDKADWNEATKEAANRIENWPVEPISGFIIQATLREKTYLKAYRDAFAVHEKRLEKFPELRNGRLIKNHAQLHAAITALGAIFDISQAWRHMAHDFVDQMARDRQDAVRSDHPIVADFWEAYEFISSREVNPTHPINSSLNPQEIAINLNHFDQRVRGLGLTPINISELKKHLRSSKSRKFIAAKTVNAGGDKRAHCWIFENPFHKKERP